MVQRYSAGIRALLYVISFLFPMPVGVIVGVVIMTRGDQESSYVGKVCLVCAVVAMAAWCLCYFVFLVGMFGMMHRAMPMPGR